ncbi:MAG: MBL fold metallo-hydrolase [Dehalococcoidia bacterium]|nr:MBL fold metallo-hydrolase [Dehalococcoidia bacterium]
MEISPGVHQFSFVFDDIVPSSIYLLDGPEGSIMIDTGLNEPGIFEQLLTQFAADGVRPQDIRDIVITHFHADHIGLAARFKELSGARILMHHDESVTRDEIYRYGESPASGHVEEWLRKNGAPLSLIHTLRDSYAKSWSHVLHVPPPDMEIDDGAVVSNGRFNLSVVSAPGHSKGHICLYEPAEKLLFSGDHIAHGLTYVGIDPYNSDDPWGDYVGSLPRLRDLPARLILPAHGKPFASMTDRIERQLRFHEERQCDILHGLGNTPTTTYDVARSLTWRHIGTKEFEALALKNKRRAVAEIAAELEFLCSSGKIIRRQQNGCRSYVVNDHAGDNTHTGH